MLKVTVELWPGGREVAKREIASMTIVNVTGDETGLDDYAIHVVEGVNPPANRGRWESKGLLTGLDRRQSVFALLSVASNWAAAEAEKR